MARLRSSIYDLGYQPYTGPRLGRRHAVWALYTYSLRVVFGIGRSFWSKVVPFGVLIIASIPAAFQVGIATIAPEDADIAQHEDFYFTIGILLALLCAVVAPELMGRDQRTRTLPLYFSRALHPEDYAIAKFAAMTTVMCLITIAPQLVVFIGNAAIRDTADYVADHWTDIVGIIGAGLVLSLFMSGLALAIAAQTPRRAYSTVAILATFVLSSAIFGGIYNAGGGDAKFALFFSWFHITNGMALWMFGVDPNPQDYEDLAKANIPGVLFVIDALVIAAVSLYIMIRRYRNISA